MFKSNLLVALCGAFALSVTSGSAFAAAPEFQPQKLVLKNIPKPTGPAVKLFNGKDLKDWTGWLGYRDPSLTYNAGKAKPIGPGGVGTIFTVVTEDGAPALRVSGETWGSLVHKGNYANYHLHLEYKWSGKRYAPRLDAPENNGLLYHSHGKPGAVWGTWSRAVEFEIMTGSVGMVVPVGNGLRVDTSVAHDDTLIDPKQRYMFGAPLGSAVGNTANWNVENNVNADKPVGEWNTLDLYVFANHAVHVVNGVPVMEVWGICDKASEKAPCLPLIRGAIQLQSEGAETFFRNITLEPISSLPAIELAK
ncbi:DUF1080 domain-containing protein [Asticcacaulis sp. 201]|uniref:3-keto-disaccharide hydrolase n=1 Tax=Asticcacaulis sp. 201 TaxID=3028787 RepID=UPI002915E80B|nr:DUF1080 domain-containing protein [Asticcacaulis sp. 201]MDV6333110.1 DUF1080 domain-containing protein [Asticcacaulis sp. 201]